MLLSLGLALLGQSSIASAQMSGSGLRVFPGTGPLSNFPGVSWRYNGELNPWGSNPNLEFVPMIKDENAVQSLQAAIGSWLATPEISHVFSLGTPWLGGPLGIGISAAKGAELQKKITAEIKGPGMNLFRLGTPSIKVFQDAVDPAGLDWLKEMIATCGDECLTDFLVVDYEGDDAANLAGAMGWLHFAFELPIWIKSISCVTREGGYCTPEVASLLMNDSIGWFKSDPEQVTERWAWDGADPLIAAIGDPTGMLNADGTLNAMGKKYDELR